MKASCKTNPSDIHPAVLSLCRGLSAVGSLTCITPCAAVLYLWLYRRENKFSITMAIVIPTFPLFQTTPLLKVFNAIFCGHESYGMSVWEVALAWTWTQPLQSYEIGFGKTRTRWTHGRLTSILSICLISSSKLILSYVADLEIKNNPEQAQLYIKTPNGFHSHVSPRLLVLSEALIIFAACEQYAENLSMDKAWNFSMEPTFLLAVFLYR